MAYVHVDDDEVLGDIDTDRLKEELRKRRAIMPDADPEEAIALLLKCKCPAELLEPIKDWANGKLSLAGLRELTRF